MRRSLIVLSALLLVTVFGIAGQQVTVVAGTETANRVVDYETIFGSLEADGSLKNVRLVDQLRVFGEGDVTVTDPMSTEDFRNLLGEGDADVQDGAVVWNLPGLSGVQELITASTPDLDPPLGVVVTYFLDGERVEAEDLIGEAGSVDITFDVSNLTAESTELAYEDGAGNELTGMELVPIPMVAQLSLELPRGTFTEVEAPLAEIITQPDGDLTLFWNIVLVPPIGETQQTFNLNAMTDGFELGPIQLAGAPAAPKDRPFLAFAEEELAAGTESASSLYSGTRELSGNVDALRDGALELLDGMQQLLEGSKELTAGLEEAAAGSGELASGLGTALDGSGQITGGLGDLSAGLKKILGGLKQLADGLPAAASGAGEIAAALSAIDASLAAVKAGLQTAQAGTAQIQAGAAGIQSIAAGLAAGAGDIAAGAGDIATGAAGISAIANGVGPPLAAAAPLCDADPDCAAIQTAMLTAFACLVGGACGPDPDIDTIAGQIQGGAGLIQGGAVGIQDCLVGGGLPCSGNPSVSAIAGGIVAGAGQLFAGLGDAIAGLGSPGDAPTASIRGAINAVRKGALQLVGGVGDALAGLGDESDPNTLIGGTASALDGAGQLSAGSAKLTAGLGEAAPGSQELATGLVEAADGSGQITDGLSQAKGGASQIEQGVYLVNEVGVREISRSASQTTGELDRQLALMEAQDERAANESLLYGPPSSDQAEVVVGGSGVVLTMDALNESGQESVSRGVAAGIGLVVLGGLSLGIWGLRRRRA